MYLSTKDLSEIMRSLNIGENWQNLDFDDRRNTIDNPRFQYDSC